MVRRLVLGCGHAGEVVLGVVSTWGGDLWAVVPDDYSVDGIEEATTVVRGDPADPETYPERADTVLVLGDDTADNLAAARRAKEAFPDALFVVCTGRDGSRADFDRIADRVIDPKRIVSEYVLDSAVGTEAERTCRLLDTLRRIDGRLAVVTHNNPDPDAIGSAVALAGIARSVGVEGDPCYYGNISHQENRALMNLLDLNMRHLDDSEGIEEYAGVALVDHSRPGVNDGLDPETPIDVVIDHHPPRAPVEAAFVDLRSGVGATSTLLAEYLRRLGVDPNREVATALLYGLRVDTRDFTREAADSDFEAAAFLSPYADASVLERVESPRMSPDVLATLAAAIRNREVRDDVLTSGVGSIRNRDALAQAADKLLGMEGISISAVYGFLDGTVYLSARSRGAGIDLGEVLRDALGSIGSAGGHADMAGAQIPLGILGTVDEESSDSLSDIVDEVIAGRILEVLEDPPSSPSFDSTAVDVGFDFPLADE
ncbi:DHH family phosphoesterase [Haloplanus salilacus]|uniref:DHH family phosphoesterase n=1 Tax=Haloplanus salilacus TaxID=2949994 RepID=UPI0030D1FC9C